MKRTIFLLFLFITAYSFAGEIIVHEGESIHEALRKARDWRRTQDARSNGGITIHIKAGRYYMHEPLFLRPEDSGTQHSPLVIKGETGTIICGDAKQQHTQLWPLMEKDSKKNKDSKEEDEGMVLMERMRDFNIQKRTISIPLPPAAVRRTLTAAVKAGTLEMVVHQRWAIAILRVKSFTVLGDSIAEMSFLEPESRLEFEHPWPQPVIGGERGNSSFLLRTTEHRDGIERLMVIDGAHHIAIEGITFEQTCWNRPLHKGHVTLQGGFPLLDAYQLAVPGLPWDAGLENQAWIERPVSAVTVRNARQVKFYGCRFQHLAATALDYESIDGGTISHCSFEDIGGTAIMAGSFAESPREVHRPYSDLAQQCVGLVISDNTIHDATNEDWGAVAISVGYARECTIAENTVSTVNYSGICIGWGWTPHDTGMEENIISGNKVSDYARQLYDAGGIYTLSNQPRSQIVDNVISVPYPAPYATNHRGFPIYLDARTDGFTIDNNRITSDVSGQSSDTRPIRREEIGYNNPGSHLLFKR